MVHKNLIIRLLLVFIFTGCGNEQNKTDSSAVRENGVPKIEFERYFYNFGTISQGEKVSYTFEFENKGDAELIIKDAYAACGCTVPKYKKEPVMPGEEGYVEVLFDSRGRRGNQYKTVKIKTNTPVREKTLTIQANVITN